MNSDQPCSVLKADLLIVYNFISPNEIMKEAAFGKMLKNKGFPIEAKTRVPIDGERKSGRAIAWKADPSALEEYRHLSVKGMEQPFTPGYPAEQILLPGQQIHSPRADCITEPPRS